MNAPSSRAPARFDLDAFTEDVEALKVRLDALRGPEDAAHLRRIRRIAWALWAVGWAFAWIPNPVSVVAIALARSVRWTSIAHHVLHRGYDKVPGLAPHETSAGFAKGWRRFLDWPDPLEPEAWKREHNQLHHYRLGEVYDPDVVELNAAGMAGAPRALGVLATVGLMLVWKWLYYAPSNTRELADTQAGHRLPPEREHRVDFSLVNPFTPAGWQVWRTSWLPYGAWAFGLMPALFLPLGWQAWLSALVTSVLAELLTNVHTFVIVVTNHAGSDVYRFEGKPKGRGDFWVRQITGSVNFRTGGDLNDLLHGWLNYQIEHHVFPDMTMRQYQLAQPELKAICEAHGVPYVQESVFTRLGHVVRVMLGEERSPVLDLDEVVRLGHFPQRDAGPVTEDVAEEGLEGLLDDVLQEPLPG